MTAVSGSSTRTSTVALMVTAADPGDPFVWPSYSPNLNYDYSVDYPAIQPPTQLLPDLQPASIKDTYVDGWWSFRSGVDANPAVVSAAWVPMLNRLNNDFEYLRDVLHFPPDLRSRSGFYCAVYLFGSDLRAANGALLDGATNTDQGGWQSAVRYNGVDWPNVFLSYYPVMCFNPAYTGSDAEYQRGAVVHEAIHAVQASMPGCKNAAWYHETGNTTLQGNMGADLTGDYSGMGWLSATSMTASFLPIECYSGWLTDGSFGGPSAEGVYQGNDPTGASYATWRQLFGGVQYSEAFNHFMPEFVSPGSIAWVWQHCTNRVLEGIALRPGGLGDAQTRRLIMEYHARRAFCDFGRWSGAFQALLNNNWNGMLSPEGSPRWIEAAAWRQTCYQPTTNNAGVLTSDPLTVPGWSGSNLIPLTVNGTGTVSVNFQPLGNSLIVSGAGGIPIANTGTNVIYNGPSTTPMANPTVPSNNLTCQLVYRATDGTVVYGQPVSGGTCSIRLDKPVRNNVVVAVITNTDYIFQGESSRRTRFDYRLTLGTGVTGTANVNTRWYSFVAAPAVKAIAGNGEIVLSWGAISGASSYTVKRSTTPTGPFTNIATVTRPTYTNTALSNGQTYYYIASATTSAGVSLDSVVASATPFPTTIAVGDAGFESPTTSTFAWNPSGSA